jgi:DNA-binding protein HU-beta
VNKTELIEHLSATTSVSKAEADRMLHAVLDIIAKALKKGDDITLIGFGTFLVRERAARKGRNPQTGAEIHINATKVPSFRAGKALKDEVNRGGK